ncbi:hypothetical protein [Nocardia sp. NPDC051570]|uniref:hypothetical protein n=1 Tax=Nocardia sp. NPDC051570 TaxID=3364324 RepID=UPI0037935843
MPPSVGTRVRGCLGADCEDDLGHAGDGQPAALPDPQRAGLVVADLDPCRQPLPRHRGQGDVVDFVTLAAQADSAGACGDGHVLEVERRALLHSGAGIEQRGDDRGVAGATAQRDSVMCARHLDRGRHSPSSLRDQ